MSMFENIMGKIIHAAEAIVGPAAASSASGNVGAPGSSTAAPIPTATASAPQAASPTSSNSAAASMQSVDVEAVLEGLASRKGGGGNWQSSIVDLLKLLDMDSSLSARKQLAAELNVHVGPDGTAEENIALHKAVMQKLADDGGKVPESFRG